MATQLLLIEDVENLGRSGEVVKVKPGFARNFLLPKGLAVFADKNALRIQVKLQEERLKIAAEDRTEAEHLAKLIEGITISSIVKVDQEGNMYGSVSQVDVKHLLEEQHKVVVEKKNIQLKHPIKTIGVHSIQLRLKEDVEVTFTLKVVSEGAEVEVPPIKEKEAESEEV